MTRRALLGAALLAACGGDDGPVDPGVCSVDGGAACFQLPTAAMIAHAGDVTGPAAIGCGPVTPVDSTMPVDVSGTVRDYGGAPVAGAALEVYSDDRYDAPVITATGDAAGAYAVTLPSGTPDVLYGKVTAADHVDIYVHQARVDLTTTPVGPIDWLTTTPEFLATTAALVDDEIEPGTATLASIVWDCDRAAIEHAAVVLSATAGERDFVPGASIYYAAPGGLPLPVPPEDRADTADNAAAAIINAPAGGTLFVQVWGFADQAAVADGEAGLTLVAEHAVVRFPDSGVIVNLWANQ